MLLCRWSLIAGRVPGRTDNQVKNHWNTYLSKKLGLKNKKSKVGVSSSTLPRESREVEETLRLPKDSSSKVPSCDSNGETEPKVDEVSQEAVDACDTQEPVMSDYHMNSFWFCSDDLNLNTTALINLLDEYPLDVVWHDL